MGSQYTNILRAPPMFKNYGPSSCAFLTKWTNLTKDHLEYQWPLWRILKSRNERNAYFSWYFEAS